jgi:hypothetical protein
MAASGAGDCPRAAQSLRPLEVLCTANRPRFPAVPPGLGLIGASRFPTLKRGANVVQSLRDERPEDFPDNYVVCPVNLDVLGPGGIVWM